MAHVHRFFVTGEVSPQQSVALGEADRRHAGVLRLRAGDGVELVDERAQLWAGTFDAPDQVVATELLMEGEAGPDITLFAGVCSGQRWDSLVDGAVQAGVSTIVPVVENESGRTAARRRTARSARIAEAAAKQAKRLRIPTVTEPILMGDLPDGPGLVLATGSDQPLVSAEVSGESVLIFVGPPEGIDTGVVEQLQARGWARCGLGHTVLRTELAAAVAVSIVAQKGNLSFAAR